MPPESTGGQFKWDGETEVDTALVIVRAVAAVANTPVSHLPPLSRAVDPDALERLAPDATMQFSYHDYEITVENPRSLTLRPRQAETELSE